MVSQMLTEQEPMMARTRPARTSTKLLRVQPEAVMAKRGEPSGICLSGDEGLQGCGARSRLGCL